MQGLAARAGARVYGAVGGVAEPSHVRRRRQTVNDLVVPLVTDGHSPGTAGNIAEAEVPLGVALGEHEVFAIGITEADPALGPGEGIAGTAGIESLIRNPAQALDVHLSVDVVGAR